MEAEVVITAEDLDPIITEAKRLGIPAYCYFARGDNSIKLSQIRAAFRMAYGPEGERVYYGEYRIGIGDRQCSKCGGSGFWCLGWDGDRPISNTGLKCFPCNGTGYIVRRHRKTHTH
jgi:hypothetical protein